MKMNKFVLLTTLALGMTAIPTFAQDGPPPADHPSPTGASGPGLAGPRPPRSPIEVVLDANGDGIISAEEIANASAALKKLDKNGDGQLTPDEYHPPRPRPGQHGPDGQSNPGAPDQQPGGQRPPPPQQ
jgi:EF hand